MISNSNHEPPTSEEMLAYLRGELSPSEEDSFRERLLPYPELVRTLTEPFPTEGAEPGDEDYLSDEDFQKHWAAMRKKRSGGVVIQLWPAMAAMAATLALVFGGLYWHVLAEQQQPYAATVDTQPLMPDGNQRGGAGEVDSVTPAGERYWLAPVLMDQRTFDSYRVELLNAGVIPQRSLWSVSDVPHLDNATLVVAVPRSFITPGLYRLAVYGVRGGNEEHLGDYTFKVPK
jgi:hypothetical protein